MGTELLHYALKKDRADGFDQIENCDGLIVADKKSYKSYFT
jgi:hypothetical protein